MEEPWPLLVVYVNWACTTAGSVNSSSSSSGRSLVTQAVLTENWFFDAAQRRENRGCPNSVAPPLAGRRVDGLAGIAVVAGFIAVLSVYVFLTVSFPMVVGFRSFLVLSNQWHRTDRNLLSGRSSVHGAAGAGQLGGGLEQGFFAGRFGFHIGLGSVLLPDQAQSGGKKYGEKFRVLRGRWLIRQFSGALTICACSSGPKAHLHPSLGHRPSSRSNPSPRA